MRLPFSHFSFPAIFYLSLSGFPESLAALSNGTHKASGTTSVPTTLQDALELLQRVDKTLHEVNKERISYPVFNQFELANASQVANARNAGPALPYEDSPAAVASVHANIVRGLNSTVPKSKKSGYNIPEEVREAARLLTESESQTPSGNHEGLATAMRTKYANQAANDTNDPSCQESPDGKLSPYGAHCDGEYKAKRASGYWMVDEQRNPGVSPFAPSGYRVWRNVMDYGAKGDGVSDDTAAINKAISDGTRCGEGCGSSTIYPAVVYFPPGTYLVSSPIIQYYNTQFLGDPHTVPTILASKYFSGLGVITSDVYVGDDVSWYLNTNNFLRSIRNFKMDLRLASTANYICAIHWQVAQGTSLENIEFYMIFNSDVPGNTQQGIYMENGSGGYLADLTFVGGNFGAYFGNQQFTTSHLVFVNCETALQVHWDWAWTMQDIVIESCQTGIVVTGGAGGPHSTGQGVGSLLLADALIANTPKGIVTSLHNDYSTSFLLQNVGFFSVGVAVEDKVQSKVLLSGGDQVLVDSWGFGRVNDATGETQFVSGADIPVMNRTDNMLGTAYDKMKANLFTRRRPKYYDITADKVMNVKTLGALGDGKTDDTAVLNGILEGAANTSSIVYIPFGVYIIRDTLKVPIGSRIIGQAWSQIMATGSKFEDEEHPKVAVQVGRPGDVGVVEIQDLLFTVSGPTAGAILVEWNAKESSKGSVGLWDSHFRVGGAIGSTLQKENCPKLSGAVNDRCKAASLLLHLTPESTAYMENVWVWVADHDLDSPGQEQIDIYAARGVLVESQQAWLWGTASEHAVLYQYQLFRAANILLAMIQTESPYFQPTPNAPQPFKTGLFASDPTFTECTSESTCAVSWAVRVIDSSSVYFLGAGLYSWFNKYSQDCLKTDDCQARGFEVQNSANIWVFNLCTKAIVEMVSPLNSLPTYARDNMNGFLSSILAWLQGARATSGRRHFEGFQFYSQEQLSSTILSESCKTALTATVECDQEVRYFQELQYRGALASLNETDSICDKGCGESLKSWFDQVSINCQDMQVFEQVATLLGGRAWAGYNETCLKSSQGEYCNDILDKFTLVDSIEEMPNAELCSECYVERNSMMQRTSYSIYDEVYKHSLDYINKGCGLSLNTTIPASLNPKPRGGEVDLCVSGEWYSSSSGETCDSIAKSKHLSSAAIYNGNPVIARCSNIPADTKLCLPLACENIYSLKEEDTCFSIERNEGNGIGYGDVQRYNPWVNYDCTNLNTTQDVFGSTICLSPPNGKFSSNKTDSHTIPPNKSEYSSFAISPQKDATVAPGTTMKCGKWYAITDDNTCASVCSRGGITAELFLQVNPSLGTELSACSGNLKQGLTYCVSPTWDWESSKPSSTSALSSSTITTNTPTPTAAFRFKTHYSSGCQGNVYNDVTLKDGGLCVDTDCKVSSLEILAEGYCPMGQIRISYWSEASCAGEWYGYGYASRGQCRTLWSGGWKYRSLYFRCAPAEEDCVNLKSCTIDALPEYNLC